VNCRHCYATLEYKFLDLGFAPPSNAYLSSEALHRSEKYYPLRVWVCNRCWLVQTEDYAQADELFNAEYAYFSSASTSWIDHAVRYVADMTRDLSLDGNSRVIEVASNDGYLLKNFVAAGVPCLGIEPTASTAAVAEALGVPVLREFFGERLASELAQQGKRADLVICNNVIAHVPDINDFTRGLAAVLKPSGTITLEFPHLLQLVSQVQFDTIYHEHFSYLSFYTLCRILEKAALRAWHVEELLTHGGSLRVFVCHDSDARENTQAVTRLLAAEEMFGLQRLTTYTGFQAEANKLKDELHAFLIEQKRAKKTTVAYGAAAKGNTLLNYAGIKSDLLPYVCDVSPSKHGKFMPGSHLPILPPTALREDRPDYVLILPWNIATEVRAQLQDLALQGTRFVTAVPRLEIT